MFTLCVHFTKSKVFCMHMFHNIISSNNLQTLGARYYSLFLSCGLLVNDSLFCDSLLGCLSWFSCSPLFIIFIHALKPDDSGLSCLFSPLLCINFFYLLKPSSFSFSDSFCLWGLLVSSSAVFFSAALFWCCCLLFSFSAAFCSGDFFWQCARILNADWLTGLTSVSVHCVLGNNAAGNAGVQGMCVARSWLGAKPSPTTALISCKGISSREISVCDRGAPVIASEKSDDLYCRTCFQWGMLHGTPYSFTRSIFQGSCCWRVLGTQSFALLRKLLHGTAIFSIWPSIRT